MKIIKELEILYNLDLQTKKTKILRRSQDYCLCECSDDGNHKSYNVGNVILDGENESLRLGAITDSSMLRLSLAEVEAIFNQNVASRDAKQLRQRTEVENQKRKQIDLEKMRLHYDKVKALRADTIRELSGLILKNGDPDKLLSDKDGMKLINRLSALETLLTPGLHAV